MSPLFLTIDGMLSGTGIRDAANGGYLEPGELGISEALQHRIGLWLSSYEDAHFHEYKDSERNITLDQEGIAISKMIRDELPNADVTYFSNASMRKIEF